MAFRRIGNTLPPIVMEADRRALEDNVPFLATSPSTSRIVEKRVTVQLVDKSSLKRCPKNPPLKVQMTG